MIRILILAVALLPQERMEKSRHPWARWKPGAHVKYTVVNQLGDRKQETTVAMTLDQVTDTDVVVTSTFGSGDQKQEQSETTELSVKDGEETLTINGKTYECTIWKSAGTRGGVKSDNRSWVPKGLDVPVKVANRTERGEEFVLTATAVGEEATAAGQKFDCVRLEGVSKRRGLENKVTLWLSPKVPSGNVRMVMESGTAAGKGTMTMEMVEFADGK